MANIVNTVAFTINIKRIYPITWLILLVFGNPPWISQPKFLFLSHCKWYFIGVLCNWYVCNWLQLFLTITFYEIALVYFTLRSAFSTISTEREKLKQMLEYDASSSPSAQIVGLKNALTSVSDMLKLTKLHWHQILLLNFRAVDFCFFGVSCVLKFAEFNCSKIL